MKSNVPSPEIFENLQEAYYEINFEWEYVYVNKVGALLAQKTKEEMLGKRVQDVFGDAHVLAFGEIAKQVMRDRKQRSLQAYYPRFNKWFENVIYPTPQGIGIFARDITEVKKAEH
ncbi:MAG TPA: PAS domain-containing protein, partial [Candidatus Saccharimonadales bacterium]|nr:PAS domain-containing protein [Candidatus Saccharimonadales bacterium]